MIAALPDRATMTVAETALVLGVHRDAAYDAVHRGDLPSIRVGRKILIPTAKLADLLGLPSPAAGSR
ncbi:helix-turn-helix domain-containing protein [Streptosporangium sp. NPDC002544]|uniref:helix-turn-helix domain-containing protein n=1 Tax=Streptosporangium sp. NPDC002544 TaxID=3154538 RepID=UPI00332D193D